MSVHVYRPSGVEVLSDEEAIVLFGVPAYGSYASQYYRGLITLDEIPETHREAVTACVSARTERWGTYQEQAAKDFEAFARLGALINVNPNNGDLDLLFSGVDRLRSNATDAEASLAVGVYPRLVGDGRLIVAGTRINWRGDLKRAAVDLWDTPDNTPDNSPTLWEDIQYRKGYRIIPNVITVGLAFSKDEIGWWGDELMRSLVDSNIYTPDQYPSNWEIVNNI